MISQPNTPPKQVRRWNNIVFLSDEITEQGKPDAPPMKDMDTMEAIVILSAALEEALDKARMEETGTPIIGVSFDEPARIPVPKINRNDQKTIILD